MAISKEAVILIPGFFAKAKNDYLDQLLALGLTSRLERYRVDLEREPIKISGQTGQQFTVYSPQNTIQKTLDIYEAFWLDLMEKLGEKPPKDQILRGLYLFFYFFTFRLWGMAKQSRLLFVQLFAVMGLVVLWYYGLIAITLTAVGENPDLLGFRVPPHLATAATQMGVAMGGWSGWILASFLLSLLPTPVGTVVNQIDFTARYLQDEIEGKKGAVRDRIRLRIKGVLDDVLKHGDYDRVTVLAHSHGVAIAIDLLADYYNPSNTPIRLMSLGGLVELYSYKSSWITEESARCLDSPALVQWTDYYSFQDWLCTQTPCPPAQHLEKFESQPIRFRVPIFKQIIGETHVAYFFDQRVLEDVLGVNSCDYQPT